MRRTLGLVAVVAVIGFLHGGCTGAGTSSCSCAAGTTYDGTFYQQYANTSVRADRSLGNSDPAHDCCGEGAPQVTVYSIDGISPDIAVATKSADGNTYFNVASGLSERQQRIADRFAKKHHKLDHQ